MMIHIAKIPFVMKSMIVIPMAIQNRIKPIILFMITSSLPISFGVEMDSHPWHIHSNIYYAGETQVISNVMKSADLRVRIYELAMYVNIPFKSLI